MPDLSNPTLEKTIMKKFGDQAEPPRLRMKFARKNKRGGSPN